MKKIVILTFIFLAFLQISCFDEEISKAQIVKGILEKSMDKPPKELFKLWHLLFQKQYKISSEEAKTRFKIFKENLGIIKNINSQNLSYKVGLNDFADLSNEEFKKKYATKKVPAMKTTPPANFLAPEDDDDLLKRNLSSLTAIDWRSFFLPIRNQGQCGDCWAFAATGTLEGNLGKKGGKPISGYLSPQQLCDCDTGDYGCNGGYLDAPLAYIYYNGVEPDIDYPYMAVQGTCKYNSLLSTQKINGYSFCSNYYSTATYQCSFTKIYTLLSEGPISVGIDGGSAGFQFYTSGIFSGACTEDDHAVILVGYGVSGTTQYWIVRNHWGPYWGMSGYIEVQVNEANNYSCFIENEGYLPLV